MNPEILDAEWYPVDELNQIRERRDQDLIRKRRELDAEFRRLTRREADPERFDPENPRTAGEYLHNNVDRRARNQSRRVTVFCQRVLLGSVAFLAWAVVMALLVG